MGGLQEKREIEGELCGRCCGLPVSSDVASHLSNRRLASHPSGYIHHSGPVRRINGYREVPITVIPAIGKKGVGKREREALLLL